MNDRRNKSEDIAPLAVAISASHCQRRTCSRLSLTALAGAIAIRHYLQKVARAGEANWRRSIGLIGAHRVRANSAKAIGRLAPHLRLQTTAFPCKRANLHANELLASALNSSNREAVS